MKTKLLKRLRNDATERVGVMFNKKNDTYEVVIDKRIIPTFEDYKEGSSHFGILGTYSSRPEAIKVCDAYRRYVILKQVREMRYKNQNRVY